VSVGAEWSKDHVSTIDAYYPHCYWSLMLDKMETGLGHLGGLVEYSEEKGGESVVAIPRFLCGSPRLCQLRTEGSVPVSKY
jgi:hypothetical protein